MSEIIYVLTVIYFAYVLEEVEGERIVAFFKDVLNLDLSAFHKVYVDFRSRCSSFIRFKSTV